MEFYGMINVYHYDFNFTTKGGFDFEKIKTT